VLHQADFMPRTKAPIDYMPCVFVVFVIVKHMLDFKD
jgi:hypothetical protein